MYFIIYWDEHDTQRIVKNLLLRRKGEEILSSLRNILMKLHEVPDQFLDHNDKFCFLVLLAFISIYLYYLFFMWITQESSIHNLLRFNYNGSCLIFSYNALCYCIWSEFDYCRLSMPEVWCPARIRQALRCLTLPR